MFSAEADLIDHFATVGSHGVDAWLAAVGGDAEVAFREDDEFFSRDVVCLDCFADNSFGVAVRVDIGLWMMLEWYWGETNNRAGGGGCTVSHVFNPTL